MRLGARFQLPNYLSIPYPPQCLQWLNRNGGAEYHARSRSRRREIFFTPSRSPGYYSIRDALTGTIRDGVPKNPFSNISPQPLPFFELDFRLVDPPGDDRTFP